MNDHVRYLAYVVGGSAAGAIAGFLLQATTLGAPGWWLVGLLGGLIAGAVAAYVKQGESIELVYVGPTTLPAGDEADAVLTEDEEPANDVPAAESEPLSVQDAPGAEPTTVDPERPTGDSRSRQAER
ncbi:MAG: hypothetical protein HY329_21360 [Chloroflexi bacterium]|nr:hypothetical protein [Chloroflexota bacterium]